MHKAHTFIHIQGSGSWVPSPIYANGIESHLYGLGSRFPSMRWVPVLGSRVSLVRWVPGVGSGVPAMR